MRLSNLKPAFDLDVQDWLFKAIPELTPYQREKIRDNEIVRFAPFKFYEARQKEKIPFWWRFTVIFLPVYFILLFAGLPFTMLLTGKWGYSKKFFDKFHLPWMNKLKL